MGKGSETSWVHKRRCLWCKYTYVHTHARAHTQTRTFSLLVRFLNRIRLCLHVCVSVWKPLPGIFPLAAQKNQGAPYGPVRLSSSLYSFLSFVSRLFFFYYSSTSVPFLFYRQFPLLAVICFFKVVRSIWWHEIKTSYNLLALFVITSTS